LAVLACLVLIAYSPGEPRTHGETNNPPNIVILFVDDMGWADLGFQQEKFITPNIDHLKKEGIWFSDARITTPTCSPSRASLLTGRHAAALQVVRHIPTYDMNNGFDRNGVASREFHVRDGDPVSMPSRNWLPLEEKTYAEVLADLGYCNVFMGKWHLGGPDYYPLRQGFDEQHFMCNWGSPVRYYPPYFTRWDEHPFPGDSTAIYLTDSITAEAVRFIENYERDGPFQLSVYYYTVHAPIQGRLDLVRRYRETGMTETEA